MALTPEIRTAQAQTFAVTRASGPIHALQAQSLTVYNIPALRIDATFAQENIVYRRVAQNINVTQAIPLAIYRGRISHPEVRAWTFTLDNHDFYVLRLGDDETLVYDTYSEQWVEWGNGDNPVWFVNSGMTWLGGKRLAQDFGSSVVVGDDTYGRLWLLDPEQPYDEANSPVDWTPQRAFSRIVMGQVPARGREAISCFAIFLAGDNYGIGTSQIAAGVSLQTSDDAGKTYADHGYISVDPQTVGQTYEWLSLGQIEAPGRLFKITDNGVFARIDGMDMNDGE